MKYTFFSALLLISSVVSVSAMQQNEMLELENHIKALPQDIKSYMHPFTLLNSIDQTVNNALHAPDAVKKVARLRLVNRAFRDRISSAETQVALMHKLEARFNLTPFLAAYFLYNNQSTTSSNILYRLPKHFRIDPKDLRTYPSNAVMDHIYPLIEDWYAQHKIDMEKKAGYPFYSFENTMINDPRKEWPYNIAHILTGTGTECRMEFRDFSHPLITPNDT